MTDSFDEPARKQGCGAPVKSRSDPAPQRQEAPPQNRLQRVSGKLLGHRDIVVGSVSLMGSTIVTSVGGFFFWLVVARTFSPTEMGHATAIVSSVTVLSVLGVFGLGTMLVGQLAQDRTRIDPLLPAALGVSAVLSAALATCFALVVASLPNMGLHHVFGTHWPTYVLFIVGVAVSSWALVLDQASLGVTGGYVQMTRMMRNTVLVALRIPGVFLLALLLGRTSDTVLIVWASTVVLSVAITARPLRRRGVPSMRLRSPRHLRGLVTQIAHYNTLNMAISIPRLAMPVVVAAFAPGKSTAVFYVSWMLVGFLYLVPTHLSTTLFAVSTRDPETLRRKVRFTLSVSAIAGCIGMPLLALLAHPVLSIFRPEYADFGATTLAILTLAYVPIVIKQHYAAISRVRDRVRTAGMVCMIGAIVELVAVAAAMKVGGGIDRAATLLCGVLFIEGLIMLPPVIGILRSNRVSVA